MDTTLTALLAAADRGDEPAAKAAFALLYKELHRLAQRELGEARTTVDARGDDAPARGLPRHGAARRHRSSRTGPFHGLRRPRSCARSIIDYVRSRRAQKRGGQFEITALETDVGPAPAAGCGSRRMSGSRSRSWPRVDPAAGRGRGPQVLLRLHVRRDRRDAPASRSAPSSATGRRRGCSCTRRCGTAACPTDLRSNVAFGRPLAMTWVGGRARVRTRRMANWDAARWRAISSAVDEILDLRPDRKEEALAALRARNAHAGGRRCAPARRAAGRPGEALSRRRGRRRAADGRGDVRSRSGHEWPAPRAAARLDFGGYRVFRLLGRGGMGAVYEADEIDSGRRVALKVLEERLNDARERERFNREGRLAASINHPHCVFVFARLGVDGRPDRDGADAGHARRPLEAARPASVGRGRRRRLQLVPGSRPPRRSGSSIATSSRRTASSTPTAWSRSATSAFPAPCARPRRPRFRPAAGSPRRPPMRRRSSSAARRSTCGRTSTVWAPPSMSC